MLGGVWVDPHPVDFMNNFIARLGRSPKPIISFLTDAALGGRFSIVSQKSVATKINEKL